VPSSDSLLTAGDSAEEASGSAPVGNKKATEVEPVRGLVKKAAAAGCSTAGLAFKLPDLNEALDNQVR
jgi:hypothetical protein